LGVENGVKSLGEFFCEFEVLLLVLTHRDIVGFIEEDICGHENRIGVDSKTAILGLLLFILDHHV
jgi:hypothetical protein